MPTIEERLAYVEGRVQEHSRATDEFGAGIVCLDGRTYALDLKVDRFREELATRIDALDAKVSRQVVWLVGMQVTTLVAIVAALLARA